MPGSALPLLAGLHLPESAGTVSHSGEDQGVLLERCGSLAQLPRIGARIRDVVELGNSRLAQGSLRGALECAESLRRLLQVYRDLSYSEEAGPRDDVGYEDFLETCSVLLTPYLLTVTTEKADGHTRVTGRIGLPAVRQSAAQLAHRVPYLLRPREQVLVARWEDHEPVVSPARLPLTGEATLNFDLPDTVTECSILFFREGQLLDRWCLSRETDHGEDQWRLWLE